MKLKLSSAAMLRNLGLRLLILAVGFGVFFGIAYAAGKWLVPCSDAADKAILAAINPDRYAPGLDQFFRALTDYTNFLIGLALLSWIAAYGLYRLMPRSKRIWAGLLAAETVIVAGLAAAGKIMPNSVYVGVNVLFVAATVAVLGWTAWHFRTTDRDDLRRLSGVFGLILVSIYLVDARATNPIKAAVARPRPFNDANKPWNDGVRPIPDELLRGANSYPSGHTSGTFALLTPLFWYARDRRVRAGLFAWGVLQGVSRVYTAAHFPTDCLMGAFLGFGIGTLVFFTLGGPRLWDAECQNGGAEAAASPGDVK